MARVPNDTVAKWQTCHYVGDMNLTDTVNQFHQAYSRHDLEGLLAHLTDDVVIQFPTSPQPIRGKESIRPVWAEVLSTIIPDIQQELLSTVEQGRTVACEFTETGTLTIPAAAAESAGLSPDGRPYRLTMVSFYDFTVDGLIANIRSYWDTGSFAEQIGIDIAVIRAMQVREHAA